jgi:hypothetical protein
MESTDTHAQRTSYKNIIDKNKKKKTCTPIDVAIPADSIVKRRKTERKLKYSS